MWKLENATMFFTGGKKADAAAALTAEQCPLFSHDCEEECEAEEERSCYNCRYRRWTRDSFACMKGAPK